MELLLPLAVILVSFVIFQINRAQQRQLLAALDAKGLRYETLKFGPFEWVRRIFAEEEGRTAVAERAMSGGRNSTPIWVVEVTPCELANRTQLNLSRENVFTALADLVGFKDIEIGDPEFDKAIRIRGDDPTLIREMLGTDEARAAARRLFAERNIESIEIKQGRLRIRADRRRGNEADAAEAILTAALNLTAALDGRQSAFSW